jgi:hypothetical protein
MTESHLQIDSTDYRLFLTRESNHYRVFWFCPFKDCYGSFRSEQLCTTKEAALKLGREAAERHHASAHAPVWDTYSEELAENRTGPMRIFG